MEQRQCPQASLARRAAPMTQPDSSAFTQERATTALLLMFVPCTVPFDGRSPATASGATDATQQEAAIDCPLGVRWALTNPYPQLSDAKVFIDDWEEGRILVLTFRGEQLSATNPHQGTLVETDADGQDTTITFALSRPGSQYVCHSGHVGADGAFVRDTFCPDQYGANGGPFISFQLQPGPTTAPEISCPRTYPPSPSEPGRAFDPYTTMYMSPPPRPSPSPAPPFPPPPPPTTDAHGACQAGGTAKVMDSRLDGDTQTWNVLVQPDYMWPTGYVYVVGLQGLQMAVHDAVGATLLPGTNGARRYDEIREYIFMPSPTRPRFSFTVSGVDLILSSLTCRMQQPPPPPSPAPPSPPPPPMPPPLPIFGQSFASRMAMGVIVLVGCAALYTRFKGARLARWLQKQLSEFPFALSGLAARYSAAEGMNCTSSCATANHRTSPRRQPSSISDYDADDADDYWSVVLQLGGRDVDAPALPTSCASSATELKQAIADMTLHVLGPRSTPPEWMDGELDTMRIQYLTVQSRLATMRPSTNFRVVANSKVLQVSWQSQ